MLLHYFHLSIHYFDQLQNYYYFNYWEWEFTYFLDLILALNYLFHLIILLLMIIILLFGFRCYFFSNLACKYFIIRNSLIIHFGFWLNFPYCACFFNKFLLLISKMKWIIYFIFIYKYFLYLKWLINKKQMK